MSILPAQKIIFTMLALMGLGGQEMLFVFVALFPFNLIALIPIWKILQKSGQNPWLSLITLVPGVGLMIALYVAAFSNWQSSDPRQ